MVPEAWGKSRQIRLFVSSTFAICRRSGMLSRAIAFRWHASILQGTVWVLRKLTYVGGFRWRSRRRASWRCAFMS